MVCQLRAFQLHKLMTYKEHGCNARQSWKECLGCTDFMHMTNGCHISRPHITVYTVVGHSYAMLTAYLTSLTDMSQRANPFC